MDVRFDGTPPVYVYDGSFDGVLCCLFASYTYREMPAEVVRDYAGFLPCRRIETADEQAGRVRRGIYAKMGREAYDIGVQAYLSERDGVERDLLAFYRYGFEVGKDICRRMGDERVHRILRAAQYTRNERHRMLQFLRFSDTGGVLTSVIAPAANVLPLLGGHFAARFPRERFLIYDETRRVALVHEGGKTALLPLESYLQPSPDETERAYRELFRLFYDTIEIDARHNERCRLSHMPKRFWKNMTEFLSDPPRDDALPPAK